MTHRTFERAVLFIGLAALALSPARVSYAGDVCDLWKGWGSTERAEFMAKIDNAGRDATSKAQRADPDVSWGDQEDEALGKCLRSSRGQFEAAMDELCQAGADDEEIFEKIATLGAERITTCQAFCPDWNGWGSSERGAFLDKVDAPALRIVEDKNPTSDQRTTFVACQKESRGAIQARLDAACEGSISYTDAVQILSTAETACLREAGLDE